MLLSSSLHRGADQHAQSHQEPSLTLPPSTASNTPPLPNTQTRTSANVGCKQSNADSPCSPSLSSFSSSSPYMRPLAITNPHRQVQEAEYPQPLASSPLLPNQQSSHDAHESPFEPSDTDPASILELWKAVLFRSDHPPPSLASYDTMASSSAFRSFGVQHDVLDPYTVLLGEYGITITYDHSDLSLGWEAIRNAPRALTQGTPAGHDDNGGGGTKLQVKNTTSLEAMKLAAECGALKSDSDKGRIAYFEFVVGRILGACDLPGHKVHNNWSMVLRSADHPSKPYQLLPATESPPSQSVAGRGTATKPAVQDRVPSRYRGGVAGHAPRANTNKAASTRPLQLAEVPPPPKEKLSLFQDDVDCAYWLDTSQFPFHSSWIARQTFVTSGSPRKLSPYLSVAFKGSWYATADTEKLSEVHKLAIHGATALYNRRLLSIDAAKKVPGMSTVQDRNLRDIHFGLAISSWDVSLFFFQCRVEEGQNGRGEAGVAWHGCTMSFIGKWDLTDADELEELLDRLRLVAKWATGVYVPGLQADLAQLRPHTT